MNFQDVKNAPEKQWVDGVGVTVLNIVAAPMDKWDNYIQMVLGKDAQGQQVSIKHQTKFPEALLDNDDLNKTLPFRLKWWNSKGGAQISGYCTRPKQLKTPTATESGVPPQGEPASQWPSDGGKQPPAKAPDWDAKDERIVRQNTLNRAVELYLHTANPEAWPISAEDGVQICLLAERFRGYVYNGPLSPGDQFAKEQGLPTAAEEAAENNQSAEQGYPLF